MKEDTSKKCQFKKTSGASCGAWAMKDSPYCFTHNPDMAVERKSAVLKGGLAQKKQLNLPRVDIQNPKDISKFLNKVVNELRTGKIDRRVANALGYLGGHLVKSMEVGIMEDRVVEIEKALKIKRPQEVEQEANELLGSKQSSPQ